MGNELKHNACKLAKWTVQALLVGSDIIKFGYITRFKVKDSSRHVILGSQQLKPLEFANQINLSMDNAWGIVRCIIDLVMQQKDGKYLIVKDPNKPVLRYMTFRTIHLKATKTLTKMMTLKVLMAKNEGDANHHCVLLYT